MAGDPQDGHDHSSTQSSATEFERRTPGNGAGDTRVGQRTEPGQRRPLREDTEEMTHEIGADVDAEGGNGRPANGAEGGASVPPTIPDEPRAQFGSSAIPATETQAGGPDDGEPPDEPGWNGAEGSRPKGESQTRTLVREILETGLLALLVFLAVRASFQNFKVDGESMMPTLHNGEFLIVNKIEYAQVNAAALSRFIPFMHTSPGEKENVFHGPQRGDIVVLVDPRQPSMDLVKRVIGLPGETIHIVDGHVYINNHYLPEPYIKVQWHYTGPPVTIPAGEYFVMGDNRSNSLDSRSPQVGLIPRNLIIGKAMFAYWPLSKFGPAPNHSPKPSKTQVLTPAAASSY